MKAFSKSAMLTGFLSLLTPFTYVHGDINVVVDVAAENSPEASLEGVLNQLCPRLILLVPSNPDMAELQQFCLALQSATPEEKQAAYRALSARMASSQTTLMMRGPQSLPVDIIDKRLEALRRAAQNATRARFEFDMNGRTIIGGLHDATGGGASADVQRASRWSGFATALYTGTEQSETSTLAGFRGKTYGAVLGADYRFMDNLFSGAALRYAQSDFDLNANGGSLEASDLNLTLYGTYYPRDQWYLDWTLHYGQGQFDLSRRINFTVGALTVNETAGSSTDGSQYGASVGGGYEWAFNNGALVQLNATFRYNQATTDAYDETSAGGYNLRVEEQTIDTMLGKLGTQATWPFSFKWGVLIPQVNVNYFYEFIDDGEAVNATFVSDPFNTRFVFTTEKRDTGYFTTAIGLVTQLPGGFTAYLQNETFLQMDNYRQSAWSLGARMEF